MQSFVTQSFTRMARAAELTRDILLQAGLDGRHLALEQSRGSDAGAAPRRSSTETGLELVVSFKVDEVSR